MAEMRHRQHLLEENRRVRDALIERKQRMIRNDPLSQSERYEIRDELWRAIDLLERTDKALSERVAEIQIEGDTPAQ
jgi:hypothetical protein